MMLSKGVNNFLELQYFKSNSASFNNIVHYLIPCTVSICMTACNKGGVALVHLKMCSRSCILTR